MRYNFSFSISILLVLSLVITGGCTTNECVLNINQDLTGSASFTIALHRTLESEPSLLWRGLCQRIFSKEALAAGVLKRDYALYSHKENVAWLAVIENYSTKTDPSQIDTARLRSDVTQYFENMKSGATLVSLEIEHKTDKLVFSGSIVFENFDKFFESMRQFAPPPLCVIQGRIWYDPKLFIKATPVKPTTSPAGSKRANYALLSKEILDSSLNGLRADNTDTVMAFMNAILYRKDNIQINLPRKVKYSEKSPLGFVESETNIVHYNFVGQEWIDQLSQLMAADNYETWMWLYGGISDDSIKFKLFRMFSGESPLVRLDLSVNTMNSIPDTIAHPESGSRGNPKNKD